MRKELPVALSYELNSPVACTQGNWVSAIPYARKNWNEVGPLKEIFLGESVPDMEDKPALLAHVMEGLIKRRTPRSVQAGIMAIDIVNQCRNRHEDYPKSAIQPEPERLERIGTVVLAAPGAERFSVSVRHRPGTKIEELAYDPPLDGAGPVSRYVVMESTSAERQMSPIASAIRSAPFMQTFPAAIVALRGHEDIFWPHG